MMTTMIKSKNTWFYNQKNSSAHASCCMLHFLDNYPLDNYGKEIPYAIFVEDVKTRQILLLFFEPEYSP